MAMTPHDRARAAIDRLIPDYRTLLQRLVRVPSPAGQEGEAQAIVAARMGAIGLDVRSFDIDPGKIERLPGFNPTPREYAGRPCVVGRAAGRGGGRSLLLNAHIDTVPVESATSWTHPPYSGAIENDRLYGRGACDDKAGVVECLLVAHALKDAGVTLAGDLTIASVVEDESSGNGTLATIEQGFTADGVIIVDGTWPERFIVSHMGQVTFQVRVPGVAGHATSPGPNPALFAGPVIEALRGLVAERNAACATPWGEKAAPYFVNIGVVRAGVWPGSVPAECTIEGQLGFVPPDTCEGMKAAVRAAVARAVPDGQVSFGGLETPPHLGDPGNPLVRALTAIVNRHDGAAMRESIISGHCDLRHYANARAGATTAACLYGPGGGRNVHGADEYFELAHLPLVAGNLACLAIDWCGATE